MVEGGSIKKRMRSKAARALVRYTASAIEDLKGEEDEMLRGACIIRYDDMYTRIHQRTVFMVRYTASAIEDLEGEEDKMLRGMIIENNPCSPKNHAFHLDIPNAPQSHRLRQ